MVSARKRAQYSLPKIQGSVFEFVISVRLVICIHLRSLVGVEMLEEAFSVERSAKQT